MWGYFVGGVLFTGLIWKVNSTVKRVEATKQTFDMVVSNPTTTETLEVDRYAGSPFDLFCFRTVKMFQRLGRKSDTLPLTRGYCGVSEYVVFNDHVYDIVQNGQN